MIKYHYSSSSPVGTTRGSFKYNGTTITWRLAPLTPTMERGRELRFYSFAINGVPVTDMWASSVEKAIQTFKKQGWVAPDSPVMKAFKERGWA